MKALAKKQEIEGEKKLTLLDIAQHVANIADALEDTPKEDLEGRQALQGQLEEFILTAGADKIDGVGWFLRKRELELAGLKTTEAIIQGKKKAITRSIDRMYDLLHWAMLKMNITQVQGQITTVTLCGGRVGGPEVLDPSKLPAEYWKVIPEQRVPDLDKIEQDLKARKDVPGAQLKQGSDHIRVT